MKNKLFRLGIYCLVLLMITATLLVGGSFSKFTLSSPDVSGIPSLMVARLTEEDIEVEPLDPDDDSRQSAGGFTVDDPDNQVILYAFNIINNSEVPVTCGLDFWAHISGIGDLDAGNLSKMKVFLYAGEKEFPFYEDGFPTKENDNIHVSTDEEAIFVEEETTCAIVLDFGECNKNALADTLSISLGGSDVGEPEDAITLTTVKQAKGKEEES